MINRYCEVCKQFNSGFNWVLRISDDKGYVEIQGHKDCIDKLHSQVKGLKNSNKKSVSQILKEINYKGK